MPENKRPSVALTLRDQIEKARGEIQKVLPKHMDLERVIRGVRLAIAQNPQILECDPKTVLFSVMAASRIGLELNSPLHHAWLMPFKKECTLIIGYQGYQELARRSDIVRNIEARLVFEGDKFHVYYGTEPRIEHEPGGETDPEKLTHVYAVAFDKNGKQMGFDVLTAEDVERARKVSRQPDGIMWKQHKGEAWRKTSVRRLAKYLPLSADLAAAIELDLRAETGVVSEPIDGIDTDSSLAADMQGKTEEKLEELKQRMEGQPPKAGAVEPAAAATATAAPSAPPPTQEQGPEPTPPKPKQATAAAAKEGEGAPPW
jgi:recombination protein RecT